MRKLLIALALLLISPALTHANASAVAGCGTVPKYAGTTFAPYEQAEYDANGLLQIHFKLQPAGVTWQWGTAYGVLHDGCQPGLPSANSYYYVSLPTGQTDWSVRFASTTHYDLWNDTTNTKIVCNVLGAQNPCSVDVPNLPGYYLFGLHGNTPSGGAQFNSAFYSILQNPPAPPVLANSLPTPPGCPAFSVQSGAYIFDPTYEQAEYVGGLLRVHYRFNSGAPTFPSTLLLSGEPCKVTVPFNISQNTRLPSGTRYWSIRFSSPTHYNLWDDDREVKCTYTGGGCSVDLPQGANPKYVAFYANQGNPNLYMVGTPFAIATSTTPPPPPVVNYVSINSTTDTATLYLDLAKTNKIKELPNGWAFELLDDTGPIWKVRDVADNLTAYIEGTNVQNAGNPSANASLKQQAARLSPDTTSARAKAVLENVVNYWDNSTDGGAKASVSTLNSTLYNFVKTSGFPKELFLAMMSHESSGYNNEFVSFDYGHGITQSTVIGYSKDVSYLQILLKKLGHYASTTPITGVFNETTKTAVVAFQTANGVSPASGLVGPLTVPVLNQNLAAERANIQSTDIPDGFTFRMYMQVGMSTDRLSTFDNRSGLLGIKIYPCLGYKDFTSQTAPDGYKNCYANYGMKANTAMSTPLATYYQNTPQSISSNLISGLSILAGAYNYRANAVDSSPLPDIWKTEDGVSIDNADMKVLLAVRGYNGLGLKFSSILSKEYPDLPLDPKDLEKSCQFYFRNESNPFSATYLDAVALKTLSLNSDYSTTSLSWTTSTPLYQKLLLATRYQRELCIGSPAYLQIVDNSGNVSGFNGANIVNQIPNVVYDDQDHEAASILFPVGQYKYNLVGTETGTYKFAIVDTNAGTEQVVRSLDVPTTANEVHEHNVDWGNLSSTTGVIVRVDSNGDGIFDKVVLAGATLGATDFAKTSTTAKAYICHLPPDNQTNNKTLYLPASAILDHLAHGDTVGKCANDAKTNKNK